MAANNGRPLFEYDPASGDLTPSFAQPESFEAEQHPETNWRILISKYIGNPRESPVAAFWLNFQERLPFDWMFNLEVLAHQRLSIEIDQLPDIVFQKAFADAGDAAIIELANEAEINVVLKEQKQKKLITHLESMPVARRIEQPLRGNAVLHTLSNTPVELTMPNQIAELNEAQLLTLEKLVHYMTQDNENGAELSEIMDSSLVFWDLFNLARTDAGSRDQLAGCRAAWLAVNHLRRPYIQKTDILKAFPNWKFDSTVQRNWLLTEARKGAAGVGIAPEEGFSTVRAAIGQVSKMMHRLIPELLPGENQPVVGILKTLLRGYGEANNEIKQFNGIIPDWILKKTFAELRESDETIYSSLAASYKATSRMLAHLFIDYQLEDAELMPNAFNTQLTGLMNLQNGAGAETYLFGKLPIGPKHKLAPLIKAADDAFKILWEPRPVISVSSESNINSTFFNLMNDCLRSFTGMNLLPLASIFTPDVDLEVALSEIAANRHPSDIFQNLEKVVADWLELNYPLDIIRSTFTLMTLAEIVEKSPMQKYAGRMFSEVSLSEIAQPGSQMADGDLFMDSIILPRAAAKNLERLKSEQLIKNLPVSLGEVARALIGVEGQVLPVEYKVINSASGAHRSRISPRRSDLEQMNKYLTRIQELHPQIQIPEVMFMFFSVSGIKEIKVKVDPETGLLKIPEKRAKPLPF